MTNYVNEIFKMENLTVKNVLYDDRFYNEIFTIDIHSKQ